MLSIESEAKLSKILLSLSENERLVEISRKVLSDNNDFDPYQIFTFLDSDKKNRINSTDITNFLNIKRVFIYENEVDFIILSYDINGDGYLSYNEFVNLVKSEKSFRKTVNNYNSNDNNLPHNIEHCFTVLLEKEVQLSRNILYYLNELKSRFDYNPYEVFNSLKSYCNINFWSIKNFLDKNCIPYLENDIKDIMKRLDFNRDGQIDLCEFLKFLEFPNSVPINLCCKEINCPQITCNSYSSKNNININTSPIKNDLSLQKITEDIFNTSKENINTQNSIYIKNNNFSSPVRSPNKVYNRDLFSKEVSNYHSMKISPIRNYISNDNNNNLKSNSINNNDNSNRNNINNYNNVNINQYNNNKYDREEKQLKDYLKNLLAAEKEIEQIKINLALKQDFNVEDVYRIFRCNNKYNCIYNEDLRNGLKLLDIFTSDTDIKNLMKRFDSNKKGYLNFSEFFDMIVPFEKEYRIMIENRSSNNHIPPNCNPNVFLLSTKLILKNLFNTIIGLEDKFNNMKKRYDTLRNNLNVIFKILDQSSFGYFFFNDLQYYLHQNKILGNIKDVDLLFLRLDKNKDGKVDFCEFEDELKINF